MLFCVEAGTLSIEFSKTFAMVHELPYISRANTRGGGYFSVKRIGTRRLVLKKTVFLRGRVR